MRARLLPIVTMALVVAMLAPGPAMTAARQVEVQVRVEGQNATLWRGTAAVGPSTIVDSTGGSHTIPSASALGALDVAATRGALPYVAKNMGFGLFVDSVNGEASVPAPPWPGWMYRVNFVSPSVGAADYELKEGDSVLWYYGTYDSTPLAVALPRREVPVHRTLTVTVQGYDLAGQNSPVSGATVHVGSTTAVSDIAGQAAFKMDRIGLIGVRAVLAGHVRSGIATVKVGRLSRVTLTAVPSVVRRGHVIRLLGQLSDHSGGLANRMIVIQMRVGSRWHNIASDRTNARGVFSHPRRVWRSAEYRAVWGGDASHISARSAPVRVRVVTP